MQETGAEAVGPAICPRRHTVSEVRLRFGNIYVTRVLKNLAGAPDTSHDELLGERH